MKHAIPVVLTEICFVCLSLHFFEGYYRAEKFFQHFVWRMTLQAGELRVLNDRLRTFVLKRDPQVCDVPVRIAQNLRAESSREVPLILAALLVISTLQPAWSESDPTYGGRSVTRSKGIDRSTSRPW